MTPQTITIVLMGVSGAGKSSVMEALHERLPTAAIAEGDDFHPASNVEKMRSGHPLTDADRRPWLDAIAHWIGQQEAARRNAIVACSALKHEYRERLRDGHPSVWFAHLVAPREVLRRRMATRRGHFMPRSLIDSQLETLQDLGADKPGSTFPTDGSPGQVADAILAQLRDDGRI